MLKIRRSPDATEPDLQIESKSEKTARRESQSRGATEFSGSKLNFVLELDYWKGAFCFFVVQATAVSSGPPASRNRPVAHMRFDGIQRPAKTPLSA